ncbi:MAG: hypothetical protein ACOYXC_07005 [Candidatus Rifleibacteriota bacterium]
MTPKESTLTSLDDSIDELKKSIESVNDPKLKKELEKTLSNLVKARGKMNPCKPMGSIYVALLPFIIIFVMIGGYYFARRERAAQK